MDRPIGAELPEPPDACGRGRVLEQRDQLVAQTRRREVSDKPHLDAPAEQPGRVLVETEAMTSLVADSAEDPRRVVDERQVVEYAEDARLEIGAAAEGIDEPAE